MAIYIKVIAEIATAVLALFRSRAKPIQQHYAPISMLQPIIVHHGLSSPTLLFPVSSGELLLCTLTCVLKLSRAFNRSWYTRRHVFARRIVYTPSVMMCLLHNS